MDAPRSRRTIVFEKLERSLLIEDEFLGDDVAHDFEVWFHFAPGLEVKAIDGAVEVTDPHTSLTLIVRSLSLSGSPVLEQQFTSHDYDQMSESLSACWRFSGPPRKLSWKLSL